MSKAPLKNTFTTTGIALDDPLVPNRLFELAEPPEGVERQNVAFFLIHGGGWHAGSRNQYHPVMEYFCRQGFTVANAEYRMVDDVITAFDQLLDVRQSYAEFVRYRQLTSGETEQAIVVMGSSAGAHLATLLAYAEPGECGEPRRYRDTRLPAAWQVPAGLVSVCGPRQMTPWPRIMPQIWKRMQAAVGKPYTPETEALYQKLSPGTYFGRKPIPTFLVAAAKEKVFPNRLSEEWRSELLRQGIRCELKIYPDQNHGFLYFCDTAIQLEALDDILRFAISCVEDQ